MKLTSKDLEEVYEGETRFVKAKAMFVTPLVGGVPASREGVENYVEFAMNLVRDSQEFKDKVAEILKEEIGEREIKPDEGEKDEVASYGVNCIRKDKFGHFLMDFQIKANLKCAASRIGLFVADKAAGRKAGAKGDMAELGRVHAIGASLRDVENKRKIYLLQNGGTPVKTVYEKFMGKVSNASGSHSIVHDSEVAPAGTWFEFEFRAPDKRLKAEDFKRIFAHSGIIGFGSARSLERGKVEYQEVEIED